MNSIRIWDTASALHAVRSTLVGILSFNHYNDAILPRHETSQCLRG